MTMGENLLKKQCKIVGHTFLTRGIKSPTLITNVQEGEELSVQNITQVLTALENGEYNATFDYLYAGKAAEQPARYKQAVLEFEKLYGKRDICFISAPGRTEVGGNHTDHQHGRVLAAAINLDILCVVSHNQDNVIRIKSQGYEMDEVSLDDLERKHEEDNKAISLIRGIAYRCRQLGYKLSGFDAYTTSNVLKGSGLSSSAAFEVAVGTIISLVFNNGAISPVEIAQIGQYAENNFFGKPSGLMDQMASSVGGFITIDFADTAHPIIQPVDFEFASCGHTLCIVDTKGNHADLTPEYAAIPQEIKTVSAVFGKEYLREVEEQAFYSRMGELLQTCGGRAIMRAIHFFDENERVVHQANALKNNDFAAFKELIIASGISSFTCLQNVFPASAPQEQNLSIALALSRRLLEGSGAWRVHGGGFAGTIQAFVPNHLLEEYKSTMEAVFGKDAVHKLSIRPTGGVQVNPKA